MNKAIVTGATGFIGGSLVRELLKQNVMVYGVDIDNPKMDEFKISSKFIPVIADFTKYQDLQKMITDTDIDVFYHFAWAGGFTTAVKDYKLQLANATFAGDALIAAKKIGCKKFVYAGTYNEFEIQTFLASQHFEPRYTCIYSTGKTAANLICRTLAYNLSIEYCTGLIPMPYGEGNYSKQLANIVINCLNKKVAPKLIEGNNLYDMVYIGDIVNAFIAIGEKGKNQCGYYVGHRKLQTFKEWMIQIRDVLAPEVDLQFGEYKDTQNIDFKLIDLEALYRDTGFECTTNFSDSIRRTAHWLSMVNIKI